MLKDYSHDEFKQLTPAKRPKLWQLRNPGKTPGTGPTRCNRNASVALTPTNSFGTGKRQIEDSVAEDDQPADDPVWGKKTVITLRFAVRLVLVVMITDVPSLTTYCPHPMTVIL
jgi:hypothetical protein